MSLFTLVEAEMKIEKLRKEIDSIDSKILNLLNLRGKKVLEIAGLKKIRGVGYYSPEREKFILERLSRKNRGPITEKGLKDIYREILSACRNLEAPIRIAYLGPESSFTHLAAIEKFGSSMELIPSSNIAEVFMNVEKNEADLGVVPVENSSEGVVTYTLDMLVDSPLKIVNEIMLEITHHLVSKEKNIQKVKKVYSHPQVFGQTRIWMRNNLPNVKVMEVDSTSEAARLASLEKGSAAITGKWTAEVYGLNILRSHIEDLAHNYTRFLVISKEEAKRTGKNKTSVIFSVKDRPGALYHCLSVFAKANINLTKIESRPSRKKAWDYIFFIDLEGHIEDLRVKKALDQLEKMCIYMKILGSYPRE